MYNPKAKPTPNPCNATFLTILFITILLLLQLYLRHKTLNLHVTMPEVHVLRKHHKGFTPGPSTDPLLEAYWQQQYDEAGEQIDPPPDYFMEDMMLLKDYIYEERSNVFSRRYSPSAKRSRGILIPAGGRKYLANAFVSIKILRYKLKCTLPIVVAFWGDEIKKDIPDPTIRAIIEGQITDVEFLDLTNDVQYPQHQRPLFQQKDAFNGWKVKAYALYSAPFDEVLLLDGDNTPLMDPSPLFDLPEYRLSGSLFWPDYGCGEVPLFQSLALVGEGSSPWRRTAKVRQAESGQLLLNLKRHADVAEFTLFLNTYDEYTYVYAYGDKDLYKAAFQLAGKEASYTQVQLAPSVPLTRTIKGYNKSKGFIQHHPHGAAMFFHKTGDSKYNPDKPSPEIEKLHSLILQPSCSWAMARWPAMAATAGHYFDDISRVYSSEQCVYDLRYLDDILRDCMIDYDFVWSGVDVEPPVLQLRSDSYIIEMQREADLIFDELVSELFLTEERDKAQI